ncbi:MAG: MBL fold metallo-hydrolase [Spirochaetia bacterium]
MKVSEIYSDVFQITLGKVNVFLVKGHRGMYLIDTGAPGQEQDLEKGIAEAGSSILSIKKVFITNMHIDHVGNLRFLQDKSGAKAYASTEDTQLSGQTADTDKYTPGTIESELLGGEIIEGAEGLQVIATQDNTQLHLSYIWPEHGGVLFTPDAANSLFGISPSPVFEDTETGEKALQTISEHQFETACFSHGKPVIGKASEKFRKKWGK